MYVDCGTAVLVRWTPHTLQWIDSVAGARFAVEHLHCIASCMDCNMQHATCNWYWFINRNRELIYLRDSHKHAHIHHARLHRVIDDMIQTMCRKAVSIILSNCWSALQIHTTGPFLYGLPSGVINVFISQCNTP
jgi:hypothetical protein